MTPTRWPRRWEKQAVLLASCLGAGCTRAPAFDILGAFFPAWLICLVLGIPFAVLARWLLLRLGVTIVFPALVYLSLTALFTFALWLVFFS